MNTVWIVGGSGGLGFAVAEAFAEKGWFVVSGARSYANEKDTVKAQGGCTMKLPLDITSAAGCEAFVRRALETSPKVDVIVIAAAILNLGSCEMTSPEEYERVMQTNFIGLTRMISLVLPVMRAQHFGKIFLFSSINGLMGIPFQSAYTASKHAIEGYAECLAMETLPYGIQVCLIEPGDHRGGSSHTRLHAQAETPDSPYYDAYQRACKVIHHDESNGLYPEDLGRKVVRQAERKRIRFRLRIASIDQHFAVWMHKLLPNRLLASILNRYYHGGK